MHGTLERPRVALTMGDVAGIGPEVIAKGWPNASIHALACPLVIGHPGILRRAMEFSSQRIEIQKIAHPEEANPSEHLIPCLDPTSHELSNALPKVMPGQVDSRAGQASHDYLIKAIELSKEGRVDAITTLPLNKEALHLAGFDQPGHTEILASRCDVSDFAMMLYLATSESEATDSGKASLTGLGVVHVTLHVALRKIFEIMSIEAIASKIRLADRAMRLLMNGAPRIGVASVNPHAGEHGLFGDEEIQMIMPAVELTRNEGIDVAGPFPNDTLFLNGLQGAYDAIVAMYHDQWHIALKIAGFRRAVNVTLGLPIVRTSVAHGTAYDIAWKGLADPTSLIEAIRVAATIKQRIL